MLINTTLPLAILAIKLMLVWWIYYLALDLNRSPKRWMAFAVLMAVPAVICIKLCGRAPPRAA